MLETESFGFNTENMIRRKMSGVNLKMGKTEDEVLQLLSHSEPLTLVEIAEKLDKKPKVVFRSLRKLFEEEKITCDLKTRRYSVER